MGTAEIYNRIIEIGFDGVVPSPANVQAGAGAPTHSAAKWVLYYDLTNDHVYKNTDGATTWVRVEA